jgi:hypothetical protein
MKINIISSGSSTKPLHKSGDFILQNIYSLPKYLLVSGKILLPSKSSNRCKLKDNEFIFDKLKKIIIFKVPNIYEELNVNIINETNKN